MFEIFLGLFILVIASTMISLAIKSTIKEDGEQ